MFLVTNNSLFSRSKMLLNIKHILWILGLCHTTVIGKCLLIFIVIHTFWLTNFGEFKYADLYVHV